MMDKLIFSEALMRFFYLTFNIILLYCMPHRIIIIKEYVVLMGECNCGAIPYSVSDARDGCSIGEDAF